MIEESSSTAGNTLRRETYLQRLRPLYDDRDTVKVLTGVRRCGKSVLLRQVADEIRQSEPDKVLEINFEITDHSSIQSPDDLDRFVTDRLSSGYVMLDEVQEVPGFEIAVNSLRARGYSVFITGSK